MDRFELVKNPAEQTADAVAFIKRIAEVETDHKWIADINRACEARGIEFRTAYPAFPCQPSIDWLIEAVEKATREKVKNGKARIAVFEELVRLGKQGKPAVDGKPALEIFFEEHGLNYATEYTYARRKKKAQNG